MHIEIGGEFSTVTQFQHFLFDFECIPFAKMLFRPRVKIFIALLIFLNAQQPCSAQDGETDYASQTEATADAPAEEAPVDDAASSTDTALADGGDSTSGDDAPAAEEPATTDEGAPAEESGGNTDPPGNLLGAVGPGDTGTTPPPSSSTKPSSKPNNNRRPQDFAKKFWKGSKKLGKLTSTKKPKANKAATTKRPARKIQVPAGIGGIPNVRIRFSNRKTNKRQNNNGQKYVVISARSQNGTRTTTSTSSKPK
ncbi:uncharacterized protein LOC135940827 [Cloeon dipterum]|uniref:uncharacterized protein LOC135940827 n=1 Tax=Cloeon dipterum TaxID=197152 RepID=UPI003220562F